MTVQEFYDKCKNKDIPIVQSLYYENKDVYEYEELQEGDFSFEEDRVVF